MAMNFEKNLEFGRIAEEEVKDFLVKSGYFVINSYDFTGSNGDKAPRMEGLPGKYVIPDLDASKDGRRIWVECKHYTVAAFNKTREMFVHGIKRKHYNHYKKVEKESGCPVYLFIKEKGKQLPSGEIEETNVLLIQKLKNLKSYGCQGWHIHNDSCLVYFNREDFIKHGLTATR